MKVLIIHPRMELFGGAELVVVKLSDYLSRNKIPHALLTTHISKPLEKRLGTTRVIPYPFKKSKGGMKPLNLVKTIAALHSGVKKHQDRFDVINVHNYPGELSVFQTRKPVVWMCNEPPKVAVEFDSEKKGSVRRLAVKTLLNAERRVVRSHIASTVVADEFNRDRFRQLYGSVPAIIPYGIDHRFFSGAPKGKIRQKFQRFTLLHVGIISPMKNQMESILSLERLKPHIPGIRLILAGLGQGAYYQKIKQYIREKNLENSVDITGHVSRERVRELYHLCHLLLHPIQSQGGWLAPFEAICSGLPVIVSPEMTAARIIRDENLGVVTRDYVPAVRQLFDNPDGYTASAAQRSAWVKKNLSWDNYGQKMVAHFETVLQNH